MLVEHECQKQIVTYAQLNDAEDWRAVVDLYTTDGTFTRPSDPHTIIYGRQNILESFKTRASRVTFHIITGVVVNVSTHTSASAFSSIQLYIGSNNPDKEFPEHSRNTPILGTFHDRLVIDKGVWRFAERRGNITMK